MDGVVLQPGSTMNRIGLKIAVASVVFLGALSYLAFAGAKQGWVYHLTVDQFLSDPQYKVQRIRLFGTVETDHFSSSPAALTAAFILKGTSAQIPVVFHGVIPEMFQAGRDVVIEGRLDAAGTFQADVLMTKCASKYEAKSGGAS
jgi:cytochrome c-type biogenesis protein CcmE